MKVKRHPWSGEMQLTLILASAVTTASFSMHQVDMRHRNAYCSSPIRMADEAKRGPTYRFGSITEAVVRGVTGNNDYNFGDGTKAVIGKSAAIATAAASGVEDAMQVTDAAAKSAVESAAKAAADAAEAAGKSAADVAQASVEAATVVAEVYVAADAAGKEVTAVAAAAAADAAVKAAGASINAGAAAKEALDERYDGYQAGDISKEAAGTVINAGAAAKEALDERYDGYQFGDISKEAAGAAKGGIEQVMRKATGNEEYQFGDVTKKLAKGFLGKLSEAAGAAKEKLEEDDNKM